MSVPTCLSKYQDLIVADMHTFLDGSDRNHVKMIYYHLGWLDKSFHKVSVDPGKLSRPSIALLVNDTLGGDVLEALPAASALQIFHDFTLMHDDIEDGDTLRRHRETVWKLWGIPRAINAGDAMYTYSLQAIMRVSKNKEELLTYLLDVFQEIVYGQELDMSFTTMPVSSVKSEDYIAMISGKSATLIGASAKVGAIMAGASEKKQDDFYKFGFNLGIAYQVYDDYISIWGTQASSGKIEHMDIIDRKKTLPILLLFSAVNSEDRNTLNEIYNEDLVSHDSVIRVLDLLNKYKIKEEIENKLTDYKQVAQNALVSLSLEPSKESCFIEIINWLLPGVK